MCWKNHRNKERGISQLKEQLLRYEEIVKEIRKLELDMIEQLKQQKEKCEKLETEVTLLRRELHKANDDLNIQHKFNNNIKILDEII